MTHGNCTSLIVTFLLGHVTQLTAQSIAVKFDQIGLEQGLSQSSVFAIAQDKQGFMWFGTQDGLNRYDGYSMTVFKNNPVDSNSISDNAIWTLLCDQRGDLWIGTERGGLNRYVPAENRFYRYLHNKHDPGSLSENTVIFLYEDSQGVIWVGTRHKGLNRFDASRGIFTRFLFGSRDTIDSGALSVRAMYQDSNKNLWVGTRGYGLYMLRSDSASSPRFIQYSHDAANRNSLSSNDVRCLYSDRNGTLWVGTWGAGLNRFDLRLNERNFTRFVHQANNPASISSNFITSILEDSKGLLWIGTHDGGLHILHRKAGRFERHISDENVLTLFEDRSGILYVGTLASGVRVFDRQKNQFAHYFDDPSTTSDLQGNKVQAILEDRDGELWVATWGNSLNRFDRQRKTVRHYSLDSKVVRHRGSTLFTSLCETSDGSIWVGAIRGGLVRLDKSTGKVTVYRRDPDNLNSIYSDDVTTLYYEAGSDMLWIGYYTDAVSVYHPSKKTFEHFLFNEEKTQPSSNTVVSVIRRGKQGGVWIGTMRSGLIHLFPGSRSFTHYRTKALEHTGKTPNSNDVFSVHEDNEGFLWIGTAGGGLNKFAPRDGSFTYYTSREGLPNDVIYGILSDKANTLWLSTNKGISRFDPKTGKFKNYDIRDGLQGNEFNQGAYFASPSGELFFGGTNGFNAFFPDNVRDNEFVPPVHITNFKVFDETVPLPNPIPPGTRIELSHAQNFFSFEFVALNYSAPEKNEYAYMLAGFESDWHPASAERRYASYTNLDPGTYLLQVKGSNNHGVWNDAGTSIVIVVTPPFWMTWWFRGLAGIGIVLSVVVIGRYYLRKKITQQMRKAEREAAIERERMRIAQDMHDDLGSRLTEIRLLTEMAQKDLDGKAADMIRTVSEVAREIIATFTEIVWSVNPQNDTIEHLAEYIAQYAVDYLRKFEIRCRLDLPREFPPWKASSEIRHNVFLAVKEALNNAVKYAHAEEIHVRVHVQESVMNIIIKDFGIGFDVDEAGTRGNGLQNMCRRMHQLKGSCIITSKPGSGTAVNFAVPVMGER